MDESYVGGKKQGKRGRGAEGKTPVAVMAERSPAGGLSLDMQVVDGAGGLCLSRAAAQERRARKHHHDRRLALLPQADRHRLCP